VKKGKGYPVINNKIHCRRCYDFLRWKEKVKREEEKRQCKKK